jgi:hypothetical protein
MVARGSDQAEAHGAEALLLLLLFELVRRHDCVQDIKHRCCCLQCTAQPHDAAAMATQGVQGAKTEVAQLKFAARTSQQATNDPGAM